MTLARFPARHCEERSDEAIQNGLGEGTALAMPKAFYQFRRKFLIAAANLAG
jgi:hypothetical protein